tara:strand:- start:14963 stop:15862 length:900 start_codon:yes stop_codon:yes gene_type:complete
MAMGLSMGLTVPTTVHAAPSSVGGVALSPEAMAALDSLRGYLQGMLNSGDHGGMQHYYEMLESWADKNGVKLSEAMRAVWQMIGEAGEGIGNGGSMGGLLIVGPFVGYEGGLHQFMQDLMHPEHAKEPDFTDIPDSSTDRSADEWGSDADEYDSDGSSDGVMDNSTGQNNDDPDENDEGPPYGEGGTDGRTGEYGSETQSDDLADDGWFTEEGGAEDYPDDDGDGGEDDGIDEDADPEGDGDLISSTSVQETLLGVYVTLPDSEEQPTCVIVGSEVLADGVAVETVEIPNTSCDAYLSL